MPGDLAISLPPSVPSARDHYEQAILKCMKCTAVDERRGDVTVAPPAVERASARPIKPRFSAARPRRSSGSPARSSRRRLLAADSQ